MAYIGNQPGTGVRSRFIYTATASQTTFSGADDNSKTLKYADSAYVDVFLNGVCLVPGTDYTASTKTSIVLTQAASLSDTLEVIAYDIASMSDMSASNGGTFQADVTFAAGADLITASAGTDNVRLGEDAGASIASGGNQNITIGKDAGTAITTGDRNHLIGVSAGKAITTGDNNVAIGYVAMEANVLGDRNVAIGNEALEDMNPASNVDMYNTAVGFQAGHKVTTAINNTLIGGLAGDAITTGASNTAVGAYAMTSLTTGADNVAVGTSALDVTTTGFYNTAVGRNSLGANTTASENTAVGYAALQANTTGAGNVAVGKDALFDHTTGNGNTAIGFGAAANATDPDHSVFVGYEAAGNGTLTGHDQVIIGFRAGRALTSGAQNIFIGREAGVNTTTTSENTAVGHQSQHAGTSGGTNTSVGAQSLYNVTGFDNTAVGFTAGREISSGHNNLVLGHNAGRSTSPSGSISTGSDTICLGDNDISDLFCADTSISSSDSRDKTDVTNFTGGLDWVNALRPVTYKWDKRTWYGDDDNPYGSPDGSKKRDRLHVGFLAQEVLAIEQDNGFADTNDTSLVVRNNLEGNSYGLKYERLVPVLVNAIKELSAKNDALEARIATLEG